MPDESRKSPHFIVIYSNLCLIHLCYDTFEVFYSSNKDLQKYSCKNWLKKTKLNHFFLLCLLSVDDKLFHLLSRNITLSFKNVHRRQFINKLKFLRMTQEKKGQENQNHTTWLLKNRIILQEASSSLCLIIKIIF